MGVSCVSATIAPMADFEYESRDLEVMSFAQKYHEWIAGLFRNFLGKRVAEVGAGSGNFSALLMREPIEELVAIEPSKNMYQLLKQNTAHDARIVTHNALFADVSSGYTGHFDSIVYVNVLEHVEDDAEELIRIYESLRPGGHVCIFVPALQWLYSTHDASIGHYRRYYKKQLVARLKDAGFEVVRAHYFDILGIITWLIIIKLLKWKPASGEISFYDTYIVPISRAIEHVIVPPIGKNFVIIGKKPG